MYKIKNFIALIIFLLTLSSCSYEIKENAEEKIKVFLSKIPLIKNYINLPPAPTNLYYQTEQLINELKAFKAEDIFKEEYEKVLNAWEEAKKLYQKKYYRSAEKKLKKVNNMAKELLEKVGSYREVLKKSALEKYKQIEEKAKEIINSTKSQEEKLKIKIYLWKLRNLLEMEMFDEFEKEIQNSPF